MAEDFYVVLGIARDADPGQIRRAYRRLARIYHPDARRPDSERFRQVQRAFETLGDDEARREYDAGLPLQEPVPPAEPASRPAPSSLVEEFLGGRLPGVFRSGRQIPREADLHVELVLEPHEARTGGLLPLSIPVERVCRGCGGTGRRGLLLCRSCLGQGRMIEHDTIEISVPPRVPDGCVVRLELGDVGLPGVWLVVLVTVR
jgi:molecular chaperone DnaJ